MDPVMTQIAQAQELASSGDRAGARSAFEKVWEEISAAPDALHIVSVSYTHLTLPTIYSV